MSDSDIVAGLQAIAGLLQARIDQTAEMERRSEERIARFAPPLPPRTELPDFAAMEAKHEAQDRERRFASP